MTTDTTKLGLGVLLLAVGTAVVLYSAVTDQVVVDALAAVAALVMAAGALLVGLSERGSGV
jgi:hypothetical protein